MVVSVILENALGGVKCPRNAIVPDTRLCAFDNEPATPYYWEPRCRMGIKGCYADGCLVGRIGTHVGNFFVFVAVA